VTRFTAGYPAGVAPLRRALRALQALLREHGLVGREVRFALGVSPELWDDEAWHELASLGVWTARDAGALTALPNGLTYQAGLQAFAGEFAAAAELLEEADAIAAATGTAHFDYASPLLAALRDREARSNPPGRRPRPVPPKRRNGPTSAETPTSRPAGSRPLPVQFIRAVILFRVWPGLYGAGCVS